MLKERPHHRTPVPDPDVIRVVTELAKNPRPARFGFTMRELPGPTVCDIYRALRADEMRVGPVLKRLAAEGILTAERVGPYMTYRPVS